MGNINIEKMRAKLEALQNKGGSGDDRRWKPTEGDHTIRIVTPEDGDPFKEFYFHYNLKKFGVLCPKRNFGEECAICDFATQLWKDAKNNGDKKQERAAINLFVSQRFLSPILVRGEEAKGIRLWGYGKKAYQQLLELVLNPDYGDITDVEEGTDIGLKYGMTTTPDGKTFPNTILTPRRRTSPLCDDAVGDAEKCSQLLDSIPDFSTIYERFTPQQISEMLDEHLNPGTMKEDLVKFDQSESTMTVDKAVRELSA